MGFDILPGKIPGGFGYLAGKFTVLKIHSVRVRAQDSQNPEKY
jgi:hypothetical protein